MPVCTRTACALAVFCVAAVVESAQVEHRATFEAGGGFTPDGGATLEPAECRMERRGRSRRDLTKFFSPGGKFMYNGFGVNNGHRRRRGSHR